MRETGPLSIKCLSKKETTLWLEKNYMLLRKPKENGTKAGSKAFVYVLYNKSDVVSFVALIPDKASADIIMAFTAPRYRRHGMMSLLLRNIGAELDRNGIRYMRLSGDDTGLQNAEILHGLRFRRDELSGICTRRSAPKKKKEQYEPLVE